MGEAQSATKSVVVAPDTEAVRRMLAMLEHFQPEPVIFASVMSLAPGEDRFCALIHHTGRLCEYGETV